VGFVKEGDGGSSLYEAVKLVNSQDYFRYSERFGVLPKEMYYYV
jgi:hypothetical protein